MKRQLDNNSRTRITRAKSARTGDPILERIREDITHLDINTLTPVEALMKLNEIKKMLGN